MANKDSPREWIGNAKLTEFEIEFSPNHYKTLPSEGLPNITFPIYQYHQSARSDRPVWMTVFQEEVPKGCTIWPASQLLCHYIYAKHKLFEGNTLLELGAGVGLCGILASYFCKDIIITDGDDKVMPVLHYNVDKNNQKGNTRAVKLWWGEGLDLFLAEHNNNQRFDMIFGSDLFYEEGSLEPLWTTIDKLLKTKEENPNAKFMVLQKERLCDLIEKMRLRGLQSDFTVTEESVDDFLDMVPRTPDEKFHMLVFTRK